MSIRISTHLESVCVGLQIDARHSAKKEKIDAQFFPLSDIQFQAKK
jgi:hypothetical protein